MTILNGTAIKENPEFYTSYHKSSSGKTAEEEELIKTEKGPLILWIQTVTSLLTAFIFALYHEIFTRRRTETDREGYIPLYDVWTRIYKHQMLTRMWSIINTPIASYPGPKTVIVERTSSNYGWNVHMTKNTKECFNLGSFNYLNLSEPGNPAFLEVFNNLQKYGIGVCSPRAELGSTKIHDEVEKSIAEFLGVEDAAVFGMGFGTNAFNIPSILDKNSIVFSDEFNHASIVNGLRMSKTKYVFFKHNDCKDLEEKIRREIISAIKNNKPLSKMFIIVEGVYSMHGTIVNLPEFVRLKKKYGAFLYVDEAHSIGCLGKTGKGVAEYYNIPPSDIDFLMATLAKTFGAIGGYIGGSKDLIKMLKIRSIAHNYGTSLSVPVASFVDQLAKQLTFDPDSKIRVQKLCRISRYFRLRLREMGYIVYGDDVSPVVAILVPISTIPYFINYMQANSICLAGVSYPAVPLNEARLRCCMNAYNTKEMIDYVLEHFELLSKRLALVKISKYSAQTKSVIY